MALSAGIRESGKCADYNANVYVHVQVCAGVPKEGAMIDLTRLRGFSRPTQTTDKQQR
ncbi:hypothetical protein BURKHO8Y_10046 [Burkholderia sp. 8Y]|nr:hypothetical protein BURKHO8Y_10046 [Burkholderia sp. 8Y]